MHFNFRINFLEQTDKNTLQRKKLTLPIFGGVGTLFRRPQSLNAINEYRGRRTIKRFVEFRMHF